MSDNIWETCVICGDVRATPKHIKVRHDMTYDEYKKLVEKEKREKRKMKDRIRRRKKKMVW